MPSTSVPLAEAASLASSGDIWLFTGRKLADRAIRAATNSPVNHVAMVLAIDDMPPLLWHAELGRSLPNVWTGELQRGAQLHRLEDAVRTWAHKYGQRYTIELVFRLHDLRSWRKIVDFARGRVDVGLYSLNGCLNFYPRVTAPGVSLERDTYVHVVLTREEDAIVTGYVDGVRQFAFLDSDGEASIGAYDPLVFFRDDRETRGEEQSGGAVSLIRIFDRALTESEVAFLACAASAKDGCRG